MHLTSARAVSCGCRSRSVCVSGRLNLRRSSHCHSAGMALLWARTSCHCRHPSQPASRNSFGCSAGELSVTTHGMSRLSRSHDLAGRQHAMSLVPMLDKCLHCRHVSESVAYSSGLNSAAEALPMARQQRDGFMKRVVIEILQSQLAGATSHADALQRTAQATANVACLISAAPYLDDFTVKCARWVQQPA